MVVLGDFEFIITLFSNIILAISAIIKKGEGI